MPALIERDVFESVTARLIANKAAASRNNGSPEDTLLRAGFARCGYCGGTLVVKNRASRPHRPLYSCATLNKDRYGCLSFGITAPILDAAVWTRVETVLSDPNVIAAEVSRSRTTDSLAADVAGLERRIAEIEKRRANLARTVAMVDDAEATAPLVAELKSLAVQKLSIITELDALRMRQETAESERRRLLDLADWCAQVTGNLSTLSYQQRRDLLTALGVSVRVWRGDHPVRWELTMAIQDVAPHTNLPSIVSSSSWQRIDGPPPPRGNCEAIV